MLCFLYRKLLHKVPVKVTMKVYIYAKKVIFNEHTQSVTATCKNRVFRGEQFIWQFYKPTFLSDSLSCSGLRNTEHFPRS